MVVALKKGTPPEETRAFAEVLEQQGVTVHISQGASQTILGLIGDTSRIDEERLRAQRLVEKVLRVQAPYKRASRPFHPEDTRIAIPADGKVKTIGAGTFSIIAGPCSVESPEQIIRVAQRVKEAGADFLRGGAFKPRTSPYSFQGLGEEGLELLLTAKKETGLPIVSELMDINHIDAFDEVDIIQIGARNMQNFPLLKELGQRKKPILLKRGLASTLQELLMAAEYLLAGGNEQILLCERGIRTFEDFTRNTLDLSAVPGLKRESHLPVIVDPSHACGLAWMTPALAKAAAAAGADGVMIEVHNNPETARCDGEQSLTPEEFAPLAEVLRKYAALEGRTR
ncbi:MAG: 3-deoxy-7-phosphoheptulonate synthase [Spirochaetaceae bacterium]|jgi:3-deoxy-7-phosphoheptulonate synthase|nr:3-deoxy-7-phosphoheptulonate synthase [Spirochaetaceae bacterium]